MPDPRKTKGNQGEDLAAQALEKRGYKIVARNFRARFGEIDIIATHGQTLVFVEVKTRHGQSFGSPKGAVGRAKQQKICLAAMEYLSATGQQSAPARFDVVAITSGKNAVEMEIIQNAFENAFP